MKKNFLVLLVILVLASFLRLWKLDKVPVSLFGDELEAGYQAYSILKTGRDYSGNFLPIHFQSLAEWRTPLYLYSAVPTVAIFGINAWGVRLPAAIFGILDVIAIFLLAKELLSYGQPPVKYHPRALLAAFLLAISPWHIQYSRGGFEVTQMIFFLLMGLYFFFKSLKNGKWLWLSAVCFALTPWVYSTAKLFTPMLLVFLVIVWCKELLVLPKKYLVFGLMSLVIVGLPITYSTLFGGGTQRISYISVLSDPTTEPEVGFARLTDARMRGETGEGLTPTLLDRVIHNKFTFWGGNILHNYLQPFSTEFLFIKGDPNLRHSIGIGEFYKIELIALILGVIFFFTAKNHEPRTKLLILFWILAGVIPAALTRDGGNHATRLILILPPLIFLISYGLVEADKQLKGNFRLVFLTAYSLLLMASFVLFLHRYYVHYPWESERWWHAGYQEAIQSIKAVDKNYDKVIISMASEPAWIFFAGWYQFDPIKWQAVYHPGTNASPFPVAKLDGFGEVSHIDKFYFGAVDSSVGIYGLGKVIDNKTLYLAVAKEIGANLILEPGRTPPDLKLVKAIPYPSGEPAFYLFAKK